MALSWGRLEAIWGRVKDMTPFTKRDHVLLGTVDLLLIEHSNLKIRHERLLKEKKILLRGQSPIRPSRRKR